MKKPKILIIALTAMITVSAFMPSIALADSSVTPDKYLYNDPSKKDNLKFGDITRKLLDNVRNDVVIGQKLTDSSPNDFVIPLRFIEYVQSDDRSKPDTVYDPSNKNGAVYGSVDAYARRLQGDGSFDNLSTGTLTVSNYLSLMQRFSDGSVADYGLAATIDPDKDHTIAFIDGDKKGQLDPSKAYTVARFRYSEPKAAFTMLALYQVIDKLEAMGKLDGSEILSVDAFGNIVASGGTVLLPFFMNDNFVSKPVFNAKGISENIQPPADQFTNVGENDLYKGLTSLGGTDNTYKVAPFFTFALSDSRSGKAGIGGVLATGHYFTFFKLTTGQAYYSYTKAGSLSDWFTFLGGVSPSSSKYIGMHDHGIATNGFYVAPAGIKNPDDISTIIGMVNSDAYTNSDKSKPSLYNVFSSDKTTIMPPDADSDLMSVGQPSQKDMQNSILDIIRNPGKYVNTLTEQLLTVEYKALLTGSDQNANDSSDRIILTQNIADTPLFSWYRNSAYFIATLASGLVLLLAMLKMLSGRADKWHEILLSVILSYLCIVGPVSVFPVVISYLFDGPSMAIMSSVTNDAMVNSLNGLSKASDTTSQQTFKTELANYVVTPSSSKKNTESEDLMKFIDNDMLFKTALASVQDTFGEGATGGNLKTARKAPAGGTLKTMDDLLKYPKFVDDSEDVFGVEAILNASYQDFKDVPGGYPSKVYDTGTGKVRASAVKRISINVDNTVARYYIAGGKNIHYGDKLISDEQTIALIISTQIYSEVNEGYVKVKAVTFNSDELIQSLLMRRDFRNLINSSAVVQSDKPAFIVQRVVEKGSILAAILFGIFIIVVALYSLARAVFLFLILVVSSLIFLFAYVFVRDYKNKALLGAIISIGILMGTHLVFVSLWWMFIQFVNLV